MQKIIWILLFSSLILYADGAKQCKSYDPTAFRAYSNEAWRTGKYIPENEIAPVTGVQIWKKKWTKELNLIVLVLKMGNRIYRHPFIECHKEENGYACGGECDSGSLDFDRTMRLKLNELHFSKETMEGPQTEVLLKQTAKTWLNPKVMQCPEYVYEGQYVCYSTKIIEGGVRYKGCVRSKVSCGSQRKHHFGHYATDAKAEEAYYRCEQNRPR